MRDYLRLVADLHLAHHGQYNAGILYVDKAGLGWVLEIVGCAACVDDDCAQTLAHTGRSPQAHCTTHGILTAIPYFCRRDCLLRIGEVERTGFQVDEDELLIPASWVETEQQDFISALLSEAEETEVYPCED